MPKIIVAKNSRITSKPVLCDVLVVRDGRIVQDESGPAQASKTGKAVTVVFPDGRKRQYEIEVLPPLKYEGF